MRATYPGSLNKLHCCRGRHAKTLRSDYPSLAYSHLIDFSLENIHGLSPGTTLLKMRLLLNTLLLALATSSLAANIPFWAPPASADVQSVLSLLATEPWACDVRSWTRAPDLYPGLTTPADTRLAVNGSDCKDIVGWQVGLRFKERAIIKLK